MFYVVTLHRQVDLEPRLFGANLHKAIEDKVISEVCHGVAKLLIRCLAKAC
jgi:DNA-directed RNA polymerase subunit E'/Rpb7